jgi:TetR/AcrR family transcriptional repressor of nem operon
MKVSREQAALNHERIVETAGRMFRERGFDGIGVADLMKSAGLTHGGFYGHFESKDDLAAEVCERLVTHAAERWNEVAEQGGAKPLASLQNYYLTARHRDDRATGCIYATLAADVARRDDAKLRRAFAGGVRAMLDVLGRIVPGGTPKARRKAALVKLSTLVGAMILARAVDERALSDEILAAARDSY